MLPPTHVFNPCLLQGVYVDSLSNNKPPASRFTYWISPPPPPLTPGATEPPPGPSSKVPKFYAPTPPAPEGLVWWEYAPGVPPLPTVSSVLGAAFGKYQWRYDPNFSPNSYTFTNLDKVCRLRSTTPVCVM